MKYDENPDVMAIKEWISKESYLPQDFESLTIKKFLHSCDNSLERTKKCIEKFATSRATMPEVYTGRDPCTKRLQKALSIGNWVTYEVDNYEILAYFLNVPTLDDFDYYDVIKTFSMKCDDWIRNSEFLADYHILIYDVKYYNFKLIANANVFHFQKLLMYILESFPIKLKKIHVVNCPSFFEKLFMLVKPALTQDIIDMISFHTTLDTLHQQIDKKHLPKEYGGDAQSVEERHLSEVLKLNGQRKMFLNDNMWKADLSKKPKLNGIEESMSGSFRTLSID